MIDRHIAFTVEQALERQAAVALIGPRQVGKTTLALEIAKKYPSVYLDLESISDRDKLTDAERFLAMHEDKLVILDEIHRVPQLFQTLRGLIDKGRRRGIRTKRFLILGSASIELLRQSGESLAGRIEYIDMQPLDVLEIEDDVTSRDRLWLRGGFPDSYLAKNDVNSLRFRRNFIRTYLERDIPQFGIRIPAETLERLWIMLAHSQGTLLNASRLAMSLSLSSHTITSYIDLLVDLLLLRRLPPYQNNLGKRLVKSPKVYVRDSGLLHALLGITDLDGLFGHPVVGTSWEGFVIETLLIAAPEHATKNFYRTAAGAEIDLVLELGGNHGMWLIEIKKGLRTNLGKGFYHAHKDLQADKCFVVYAGQERYPINKDVEAIGLYELASLLAEIK
ncbi:MAG: ATP-binding protein [Thiohalomonadales bacterium]